MASVLLRHWSNGVDKGNVPFGIIIDLKVDRTVSNNMIRKYITAGAEGLYHLY